MHQLHIRGEQVSSLYSLLGNNENNMTYSLGWALSSSPNFLKRFVEGAGLPFDKRSPLKLKLQEHSTNDGGYTDIEVQGGGISVIVEAKKDRNLPGKSQLRRYVRRLLGGRKLILVVSDCSKSEAGRRLPPKIEGVRVRYMRWQEIVGMAEKSVGESPNEQKRLLRQLADYLREILSMAREEDNWVFVVPLGSGTPSWSNLSWTDFVEKKRIYCCPVGASGYPSERPYYLGFRYARKLQSIHHVEDFVITRDLRKYVPEIKAKKKWTWDHFVFYLGRPIRPAKDVRSGPIRDTKLWAYLDALLVCKTVQEAHKMSRKRQDKLRGTI